jgi:hypothetical protein
MAWLSVLSTISSRFGSNISRTAEFVGMERSALHRKLKALCCRPVSFRSSCPLSPRPAPPKLPPVRWRMGLR